MENNNINLKDYFDQRLIAVEKALTASLLSQKEAVDKAENASEKRFQSVNEFRNTLSDQQRTLMPRSEVDVLMKNVNEKISDLITRLDKTEGKGVGENTLFYYIIGFLGVALTVLGFILKK